MMKESNNLSSDLPALQKMIFALGEENNILKAKNQSLDKEVNSLSKKNKAISIELDSLSIKNQQLTFTNQKLEEQLALLRSKRFGKSSEKLKKQIEETELKIEENETLLGLNDEDSDDHTHTDGSGNDTGQGSAAREAKQEGKKRPKRQKLPEHLPREEVILNPGSQCPACGGESFRKIGDDVSEVLEYVPSSFKVIRYVRPRCTCVNCEQMVQAYAASKPIDKGKAGSGLLAHIVVQKYCNHLPLYRQSEIYAREGIDLSRTTMAGWAGYCAKLLEPLAEEIRKFIFAANKIHGDDTPVRVLEPGLGRTKVGRIWTYVVDGRGYGDQSPVAVCYFYVRHEVFERSCFNSVKYEATSITW
jgi:transposase